MKRVYWASYNGLGIQAVFRYNMDLQLSFFYAKRKEVGKQYHSILIENPSETDIITISHLIGAAESYQYI